MRHLEKTKTILKRGGFAALLKKGWNYFVTPVRVWCDMLFARLMRFISVRYFHKLFYYTFFTDMAGQNKDIRWMGVTISKCPLDSWIYQEIIWEQKPDVIIETGTDRGGSALFFASLFDLLGKGEVITIDVTDYSKNVAHPRIMKIHDSSIASHVVSKVAELVRGKKVMVVLDSDHTRDHVLKEMEIYSELVSPGCYMVVEDSNVNGHPVLPGWGKGPMEAIRAFLKMRGDFVIDRSREKFLLTFYPKGFLKKTS